MRVGVLGTMVWDRIHVRPEAEPYEGWGGIGYSLAAFSAVVPDLWTIVPIIKIGRDLADEASAFLGELDGVDAEAGIRIVDSPNNRVELHYRDEEQRTERLHGGVPPWTVAELTPALESTDALYINLISGFELGLSTMRKVRAVYPGRIYADLHSLLLGMDRDGRRVPRPLDDARAWLACFDAVQVNERELGLLAGSEGGDPWEFAESAVRDGLVSAVFVTLGARGAAYIARSNALAGRSQPSSYTAANVSGPASRSDAGGHSDSEPPVAALGGAMAEPVEGPRRHIVESAGPRRGDPTGCGDVWGAACFARLLAGDTIDAAVLAAIDVAGHAVEHRGAASLDRFLDSRVRA